MRFWKIALWSITALALTLGIALFIMERAGAATNISATTTEHFAWDDVNGWWDFYTPNTVEVFSTRLTGYASSLVGEMALDCKTSPAGNICSVSNFGICNGIGPHTTDGTCPMASSTTGTLSGFAWNDTIGWISFNCDNSSHDGGTYQCATSNYKVIIDTNGDFSGCAWNDIAGWISFNNAGACSSATTFKVNTAWRATSTVAFLQSSVFDTGIAAGAELQSIIWQGLLPADTAVDFQIATSSSASGPWAFYGPNGSIANYYGLACPNIGVGGPGTVAQPNSPICVDRTIGAARYLRYQVRLRSDRIQSASPRVDDIILNWVR